MECLDVVLRWLLYSHLREEISNFAERVYFKIKSYQHVPSDPKTCVYETFQYFL